MLTPLCLPIIGIYPCAKLFGQHSALYNIAWGTFQILPWCTHFAPTIACLDMMVMSHFYKDAMFASIQSYQGNKHPQISGSIPLRQTHESLSVMFQYDGFPPMKVMDGSKEQTLSSSTKNLEMLDADCEKMQQKYTPLAESIQMGGQGKQHGCWWEIPPKQCPMQS